MVELRHLGLLLDDLQALFLSTRRHTAIDRITASGAEDAVVAGQEQRLVRHFFRQPIPASRNHAFELGLHGGGGARSRTLLNGPDPSC